MEVKMKNVLFISPSWMDIYKDVISELERQGYYVDYIPEEKFKNDLRSRSKKTFLSKKESLAFEEFINSRWISILQEDKYGKVYDILFVLDGQSFRPIVVDILKKRNPAIRCVNYLFDTTCGVYEFDKNFHCFDKVFTFDVGESKKYGINFLPIYWVPSAVVNEDIDLFGMGRYSKERYELFKEIKRIADMAGLKYILRLHTYTINNITLYKVKYTIRKILGIVHGPSPEAYLSEFNTHESIKPSEFRLMISRSKCIVDTSAPHQDGLTARFMWALGCGKRIITTNLSVKHYSFYTPEQIFIVEKTSDIKLYGDKLVEFLKLQFVSPTQTRFYVDKYRIDNWLKTIIC